MHNRGEIATRLTFIAVAVLLSGIVIGRKLAAVNAPLSLKTPVPTETAYPSKPKIPAKIPSPIPTAVPNGEDSSLGMTASQFYEAYDTCRKTIWEAGIVPCYTEIFNRITSGGTCTELTKLSTRYCTLNLSTRECIIQCVFENITL